MITFTTGNLLEDDAQALVNTVNCVGVMGKGIALAFKKKFPANFIAYKKYCDLNLLEPGGLFAYSEIGELYGDKPQTILNVATKKHWRHPSKIEYIDGCIIELVHYIKAHNVTSVAIPPLGCGNGGLDWEIVGPKITSALSELEGLDVRLYAPELPQNTSEHDGPDLPMTQARSLLVLSLASLEKYFGGAVTRISAQKLFYFAQLIYGTQWVPFRRGQFGPYSSELATVFKKMNKAGCINGYYRNSGEIEVHPKIYAEAAEYAQGDRQIESVLDRLSKLTEGYESPYGMELLATAHFLSITENTRDAESIYSGFLRWGQRKSEAYTREAVAQAVERLQADNMMQIGDFSLQ